MGAKKIIHQLLTISAHNYTLYAFLSRVMALVASLVFPIKHYKQLREYRRLQKGAKETNKKMVVVSLSHAVTFQFVKKVCARLANDANITLVFSSGSSHLSVEKIQELTGANFVLPYGLLPAITAHVYITPKSTTFWHVPRKAVKIHVLHSPVSIHRVYSEGSFQGFDVFFANGPHHMAEFRQYLPKRGMHHFKLIETGSEIIDSYYHNRQSSQQIKSVIFAPSWGDSSALNLYGSDIIRELISLDIKVILRPHPASMVNDAALVNALRGEWASHPLFVFDDTNKGGIIDPSVDAMVSDWSGVAIEFAVGYKKPVFFLNTPQKILNKNWEKYIPYPGIEYSYRDKIGFLVNDHKDIGQIIQKINADYSYFSNKANPHYANLIFNEGNSDLHAYHAIKKLANET